MTSIRKLFLVVVALTLTAFALPASAATKSISLTVPSGPLAAGTYDISVTITNTGNSNANSFELDWIPSPNVTVNSVTLLDGTAGTPVSPGVFGSSYVGRVWNKQAPAKQPVNIVMNVTVTATCASAPVAWGAAAWTGSPGPLSTSFPLQGGPYSTTVASLPNCISCNTATNPVFPPVPGTGYFSNMPAGTTVSNPGFAAGYRLNNDTKPNTDNTCYLVDYAFTNNITGTGNTTDPSGNTLPPNTAGLVWNQALQPNAVFVYMLTYQPEYVATAAEAAADSTLTAGLPKKKTKFCILTSGSPTNCADTANQATLQACLGPAFGSASIPGTDPACIMQETWTTVPAADCSSLPNPNASLPDPTPPACVRATDLINDARDPPIIRG